MHTMFFYKSARWTDAHELFIFMFNYKSVLWTYLQQNFPYKTLQQGQINLFSQYEAVWEHKFVYKMTGHNEYGTIFIWKYYYFENKLRNKKNFPFCKF